MSEMTDKCAHPVCHCPANMDTEYCCEYCEVTKTEEENACQCGHPECQAWHSTSG